MISPELEKQLAYAYQEAKTRQNEYLTLEHLLFALLHDTECMDIVVHCGGDPASLIEELDLFLNTRVPKVTSDEDFEPIQTLAVQRVLQRAALHVQSSGKEQMSCGNVLVSMMREKESYAVYLLNKQGISRFDVVNYISHGLSKTNESNYEHVEEGEGVTARPSNDPLGEFTVDLVAKAKAGGIDPLIGRDREIRRTIQILCRRKKNNPVFVGDPGVGKTAIAEGLARRIAEGDVPEVLENANVYALDMGALLANTKFRGEFEARLKDVIKAIGKQENSILFIDEIHTIIGAGATSGGSMDASNILKPALAAGELRCIGSTTFEDYKSIFERDHALARRFQKIDVVEPSAQETFEILKGLRRYYEQHHGVKYSTAALKAAAFLAAKHINHRYLPDKAIDVIDEVGAAQHLRPESRRKKNITVKDVEHVVAEIAQIPEKSLTGDDKERLRHLERNLKLVVFDQDEAVAALVQAIKLSRSGLRAADKPVGSFLFTGPTGVGKTEVARQLARSLAINFVRFDMSEYMEKHTVSRLIGAPPGYVGFDQGGLLTDAVNKTPYCLILLDEIEKAHPDVFNILLQVMDHASLTDNVGKRADFRNALIVMTSNAGAHEMAKGSIGFQDERGTLQKGKEALEKVFSPEFRNRIDAIVHFSSLKMETVHKIVVKFLDELDHQLIERGVSLSYDQDVVTYLAEKGYSDKYGARPLSRLIDREIKELLADHILFGELASGGVAHIQCEGSGLTVHCKEKETVKS
ncbi:MAG: ATP-dependent Clp protease ATP-binding subunit ClpA [Acidobacteria bacterium]|nr:ATP-dependent Clp protease ATP-binding subunit ClpA [Acidobacteriota bacterium]